jgi:hypothetical protein
MEIAIISLPQYVHEESAKLSGRWPRPLLRQFPMIFRQA